MSASSTKAMPELIKEVSDSFARGISPAIPDPFIPTPQPSGPEALQSLLAFASLREQLRQQRAREAAATGEGPAANTWVVEQFVLDEVLQVVAERALAITGADGVAIALADGDHIVCRGSVGSIAPDRGAKLNLNSSFSGACFRNAQVVRCDDSESDPRVDIHACRRLRTRSMVAVPLSGRRNVIGLLEAFSTEAFGFNDSDVRSLTLLGELILAAIRPEEEEQLQATSERLAVEIEPPPQIVEENLAEAAAGIESSAPLQAEPEPEIMFPEPEAEPVRKHPATTGARPGLAVVFVVVVIAALFGAGLWWKIQRDSSASSVAQPIPAAAVAPPTAKSDTALPIEASAIDPSSASAVEEKLSVLPKVTGIRHWSATGSSTVVIDLQDQVQYEAHRLASPDRIYFDLHDTALTPSLTNRTIEVGDSLLVRVRVAQPMPGVTRVVLETAGDSNFSISLEPNPYRLVAELRAIGAKPQSKAQFDLFRSPSETEKAAVTAKTSEDARLLAHVPKFRIVVDAGHGGWDLGTVGRKGLLEKDLVLDVAQRLGYMLSNRLNAEVVYTRQDDSYVPLEDRAGIANQAQADLFVSVHANYSDSASARGVETYYTNTFSSVNARSHSANSAGLQDVNWANVDIREKVHESRRFAASIQRSLYAMLAQKNPAIRDRGVKEASYVVLTGTSMPAVLAEISFVSSPSDESNLLSANYRQQIANALYKGIAGYVATSHRVKLASASAKPTGR